MGRHLVRGNLYQYWQQGLLYLRRLARKSAFLFQRRLGSRYPVNNHLPYRRPRPFIRFNRRLISQIALTLLLVALGFVIALHPYETGRIITNTAIQGAKLVSAGYTWLTEELYPSLVFSFQADPEIPQRLLEEGLPGIEQGKRAGLDLASLTRQLVATVTSVNFSEVESILEAQFLGSDFKMPEYMTERAPDPALLPVETEPEVKVVEDTDYGDQPIVAIYHTHSSEDYHGRKEHRQGEQFFPGDYCWGKTDGVITVGDELARILADEYRIPVVHSRKIHDYPVFRDAYTNSRLTLENILREYPSVKVVIDLHRDGLTEPPEEAIKTVVAGENLARVAIIVGKGRPGFTNPHWEENRAFAEKLHQAMEDLYPGLSRGVIIKDWPYNQELHPQALLLEIGDHYNTRVEAIKSAHLVADALVQVLQES